MRRVEENQKKEGLGESSFVCTYLSIHKRQTVHLFAKKDVADGSLA